MSQTEKLLQEFYQQDEATLASNRKRADRERQQKLPKEATEKAVRDFQLQKQQQEEPVVANKKKRKAKAKAPKRKTKAPSRTGSYFRGSPLHKRQFRRRYQPHVPARLALRAPSTERRARHRRQAGRNSR
ncbi:hypothetical protein MTO96_025026 [Rhipicephalus appendiculatus]